ncbi:MAG TPA: LacI family DNA-binding transcriptional regulator, partial [Steroidobacteraceae bacterium]|nr:LacI family DNA-binding transcriptional regulator [Steroidobacteraceae bacterium]
MPAAKKSKNAPRGHLTSAAVVHAREPALTVLSDRKPTINDIARLASVSKKTVSRVLNQSPFVKEETRVRVDEIMRRVGYTPDPQARGLAFRRSFLIGLVYDN